jgi:hypothetical protein
MPAETPAGRQRALKVDATALWHASDARARERFLKQIEEQDVFLVRCHGEATAVHCDAFSKLHGFGYVLGAQG